MEKEIDKILVCRFCFEICKNDFEVIKDATKEILNFIQLNLDLDISSEPIICVSCINSLKECFNFKTMCQYRKTDISIKTEIVEPTAVDVSPTENAVDAGEMFIANGVCCSCKKLISSSETSVLLRTKKTGVTSVLERYLPELDSNSMCTACHKSLQNQLTFVSNCMTVEEKIREYCKTEGTDSKGQVKLSNVLHFMSKSQLPNNIFNNFAVVKMVECYEKDESGDSAKIKNENIIGIEQSGIVHIKMEDIDIKMEQAGGEWLDVLKSTHQNTLVAQNNTKQIASFKTETYLYRRTHKDSLPLDLLAYKNPSKTIYKCEMCTYQSKRKHGLLNHMLTHKYPEQLKYKCEMCTYQSRKNSDLLRHAKTHKYLSQVTLYKCQICAYQTTRKHGFSVHMLVHKDPSEIVMYKCDLCRFQTKYKYELSRHMIIHKSTSEVTMYKCDSCTYQSRRKDYLYSHMLSHKNVSEVTPYKCEVCKYQSKRKSDLSRHVLAHKRSSEVTFYKCKMCAFQTKYRGSLRRHIQTH